LADQCFKKDPVAFMDKVRADCGGLLNRCGQGSQGESEVGPHLEDHPQAALRGGSAPAPGLESCGKRSRKGKKKEDLENFLLTVNDYMAARAGVASAARDIAQAAK